MSISDAHSEAARRNGAQSHGPVTEEGRRRSSQNACKHNFFASFAALPDEDRAQFDALRDAYTEEYLPATPTEHHYVQDLADAEWRLQRVRSQMVDLQSKVMRETQQSAAGAFHHLAKEGPTLPLLLRYETKFQRQYDKAVQQLQNIQDRRAKLQQAAPDAQEGEREPEAAAEEKAEAGARQAAADHDAAADQYPRNMIAFIDSQTPGELAEAPTAQLQNEPKPPDPKPAEPRQPLILHGRLVTLNR
ncbi:MAG: hypothetical protein HY820_27115 [Acidobacteria bacterium]|nr:hypothetical protein [Acidobacteriota bacterium]